MNENKVKCPDCGMELKNDVQKCPRCGKIINCNTYCSGSCSKCGLNKQKK